MKKIANLPAPADHVALYRDEDGDLYLKHVASSGDGYASGGFHISIGRCSVRDGGFTAEGFIDALRSALAEAEAETSLTRLLAGVRRAIETGDVDYAADALTEYECCADDEEESA